jgi:hypothetical protein
MTVYRDDLARGDYANQRAAIDAALRSIPPAVRTRPRTLDRFRPDS